MRAICYPSDETGCGYYRLHWVTNALHQQGADASVGDEIRAIWEHTETGEDRVVGVDSLDADVAVFQRVFREDMLQVIRGLQQQGVAVVVDVDDDFLALDSRHPAYGFLHPKRTTTGRSWEVLRSATQLADMVTVSTLTLARRFGGHGRVRVVPNCVPRQYFTITRVSRASSPPVIGWTGTPLMHPGDLEVTGPVIHDLCAGGQARFRALGDRRTLDVLGVPEQQHQPGLALATFAYPRAVAELDLGIVPLRESAFNRSKSWLKGLEYAALGVPFVASPTPEYERLATHGAGVLADRPRAWRRELLRLLGSSDRRLAAAAQARAAVAELTIEGYMAPLVWEAWSAARANRQRRAA